MPALTKHHVAVLVLLIFIIVPVAWGSAGYTSDKAEDPPQLDNPMSVAYLKKNLRKSGPRLVLTSAIERNLKRKIKTDPIASNYYQALQLNAKEIQDKPFLEREMIGRRLLSTSREMLYRMGVLGMVYRIDKDRQVLQRIDEELKAVCNFSDWNPSHYLDVAEMALAVALAVDWVGKDLPKATVDLAINSLIEKGIKPSYPDKRTPGWVNNNNNWNQVCNGGMIGASIVIAEKDPELAAKTISRALDGIPYALEEYGPDGMYPEGATYWVYGTSFSVITSAMLESAFGTDFGIAEYPAFQESAVFRVLSEAPSGMYYNFADCGDRPGPNGSVTLAWFAMKSGNSLYLEKEKFLRAPTDMGKLERLAGPGLVWLSQIGEQDRMPLPLAWKGEGSNPVVIFRGGDDDPGRFYFGGKGGRATVNHGNMDAGSFVFELDGIRWSIDPGNQGYNELEKTGFNLWGNCQECERWTLLTKNNYGHSTLTVNDSHHVNNGFASLMDYQGDDRPQATFDMSAVFGDRLENASRQFVKESNRSLLINDLIKTNNLTKSITWQLITTADVEIVKGGAILRQDGRELKLENLSHPELTVSVISLDPAPLELDRQIADLKRIEIRIPAYLFSQKKGEISVRLHGEE